MATQAEMESLRVSQNDASFTILSRELRVLQDNDGRPTSRSGDRFSLPFLDLVCGNGIELPCYLDITAKNRTSPDDSFLQRSDLKVHAISPGKQFVDTIGEITFWFHIDDEDSGRVEVLSSLDIYDEFQGQGYGSALFQLKPQMIEYLIRSSYYLFRGMEVVEVVRDQSEGSLDPIRNITPSRRGWTSALAKQIGGYTEVEPKEGEYRRFEKVYQKAS